MNFDDIEINGQYMIYEGNVGQVKVLAKHVVGGRELIWYQKGNDHGFGQPKFFSPIPMSHAEAIKGFVSDLKVFMSYIFTDEEFYDFLDEKLRILVAKIEDGKVQW